MSTHPDGNTLGLTKHTPPDVAEVNLHLNCVMNSHSLMYSSVNNAQWVTDGHKGSRWGFV